MLGRQNKNLVLRMLKVPLKSFSRPVYQIVLARKRSKPTSRLDKVGILAYKKPYSFLKIDIRKLNKYLVNRNVKVAQNVWKVLGLDDFCRVYAQNKRVYKKFKQN